MKKLLNKFWDKLNGSKTYIGIGLHIAWFVANIVNKDLSTPTEAVYGHSLIGLITGTGLVHKGMKTEKGKEITKTITDAAKKATGK